GFWHGANWTFIAWGAFHAFLFLPEILAGKNRKFTNTVAENRILPSVKEFLQMGSTFLLVVVGWIFFRAETIHEAFAYIAGIFDKSLLSVPIFKSWDYIIPVIISLLIMFSMEWLQRTKVFALNDFEKLVKPRFFRWLIYIALIILIIQYGGKAETFIYFQF
ncbi:MAG: MBOAT family protein, partial [Prevotellaceae bacterium]|nr:MBOAT family protein [Prevotellaceae bacterium]